MFNLPISIIQSSFKRIGLHVLFWSISLSFFWLLFSRSSGDRTSTLLFILWISPITMILTYLFNYHLIPSFLVKTNYFKFVWYGVVASMLGLWLALVVGFAIWILHEELILDNVNRMMLDIPMLIASLFFVVLMGVSIKLFRINLEFQTERDKVEKEKLIIDNQLKVSELKLLKDQLNPHFLFNTLNNLYGLTLEKSDKAPDLVLRLSNMLDFMLYRTNTTFVPLQQEIDLIENYLAIEQHRFEGKYPISFKIEGEFCQLNIAPLLLLPLVENCFKHGIRKSINSSFIDIHLKIEEDILHFKTLNSIGENNDEKSGGIGLMNLKKRLDMIYPEQFQLDTKIEENQFFSYLILHLNHNL